MAQPCTSACSVWATDADICSPCDDYAFDALLIDDSLAIASDILYELSGRQFPGSCQDYVRPCSAGAGSMITRSSNGGVWRGSCSCTGATACACHHPYEITLGVYPLTSIVSIIQADTTNPAYPASTTLDSSLYRIDDYRWLVRQPDTDGGNPGWPCCQRLDRPIGEEQTFQVTFTWGQSPPAAGVRAAAALACELALACSPETIGQCRLPKRITDISRQGVSMALIDPFDFLDKGLTGIYEVDVFLRTYNPSQLRRRAGIISPDIPRHARRAGTG
jgi:hypothetical protein